MSEVLKYYSKDGHISYSEGVFYVTPSDYIAGMVCDFKRKIPAHLHLVMKNGDEARQYFDIALRNWIVKVPRAVELLGISLSQEDARDDDVRTELKTIRRRGQQLASAWLLFNNEHTLSDELQLVLKKMGKYLDRPRLKHSKGTQALELLTSHDAQEVFSGYVAATTEGYSYTTQSLAKGVISALDREELTYEEHHDLLRKPARHLLNGYKVARYSKKDEETLTMSEYLVAVNMLISATQAQLKYAFYDGRIHKQSGRVIIAEEARAIIIDCMSRFLPHPQTSLAHPTRRIIS